MGNGNVVGDRWLIELQNRSHVKCINFQCSGITLIWNFASHVVTSRLIRFKWQTLLHLASRYVVSLYFEISNIFNHCVKHKKCLLIYHLRTNIVSHYPINKRKKAHDWSRMNVSSFSLKFYFSWELLATQIFIFWEFYGPILFITLVLRYLLNSAQEFCYICFQNQYH